METRPKIKINLTQFDKTVEIGGIILLILMWTLAFINYLKSPETVPIHYDGSGNANGYGSKQTLLLLPIIPTIIFWGLTQLNKYPHIYNYMTRITEDNAARQYTIATRMIRLLKVSIVLIFTIDMLSAFLTTTGITKGPGAWSLPLTVILLAIPTVFIIVQSIKKNNKMAG